MPLQSETLEPPSPGPGQVLIKVRACGVCRTDLHLVDGELAAVPLSRSRPGHEVVGTVASTGERVGVPWLGWTCGACEYCKRGQENLCERARFTGCHLDGGYAEYLVADERFCLPIPERYGDAEAAPLLCAGLIGFRSYLKAGLRRASASTASARRRTSWRRSRAPTAGRFLPSPGLPTFLAWTSRWSAARIGPAARTRRRPSRSTRRSSSRPSGALVVDRIREIPGKADA